MDMQGPLYDSTTALPAPALLLPSMPFTCYATTGQVCNPSTCTFCGQTICAVAEHWVADLDEHAEGLVFELVHHECHRECAHPDCQED